MKPYLRKLTAYCLLGFVFSGCIKDKLEDCPEEEVIITVAPDHVWLQHAEQIPASQRLTVTTSDINGLSDQTIPWTLSLLDAND